jgi:hypothetical protein
MPCWRRHVDTCALPQVAITASTCVLIAWAPTLSHVVPLGQQCAGFHTLTCLNETALALIRALRLSMPW